MLSTDAQISPADEENSVASRNRVSARRGRMVVLPGPPGVVVVPLVAIAVDPTTNSRPTYQALPPVELSRVPTQHEYIAIAGGETLHVVSVRHLPGTDIAAELHCERLPVLPARGEASETLADAEASETRA